MKAMHIAEMPRFLVIAVWFCDLFPNHSVVLANLLHLIFQCQVCMLVKDNSDEGKYM